MEREKMKQILEDAVREEELISSEIPAIDLYVDQIISLVSEKLQSGSERYRDRQLTKTMINNYSKDGLITPVKGKKYNKEQIVQMLTVYTLKNTLSIGQIKRMLDGAYATEGFNGEALTEFYDRHLEIKKENRAMTGEVMDSLMERNDLHPENSEMDFMLTVSAMLSLSGFLRSAAQAMIDEAYPAPEEPVEKEKKERTKKEKIKLPKEQKPPKERKKKEDHTERA